MFTRTDALMYLIFFVDRITIYILDLTRNTLIFVRSYCKGFIGDFLLIRKYSMRLSENSNYSLNFSETIQINQTARLKLTLLRCLKTEIPCPIVQTKYIGEGGLSREKQFYDRD